MTDNQLHEDIGEIKALVKGLCTDMSDVKSRVTKVESHVSLVRNTFWFLRLLGATCVAILTLHWDKIAKIWSH